MPESLVSIAITSVILLGMLVFVPCLELTARGCRRMYRSRRFAGERKDPTTGATPTSQRDDSRSSNAA
jgi:hypothetical protein